jgi:arsenate reductase-like glutaredoxin family protein
VVFLKVIDFLGKKILTEKTKNEILKDFKNELEKRFSHDTAKTYYSSLNCALKTQSIKSNLRWDLILEHALTLKRPNCTVATMNRNVDSIN